MPRKKAATHRPRQYEPYRPLDALSPAAQALITYVRAHDYVSYPEMARVLAPFFDTRGRFVVEWVPLPNVLVWANMSAAWVAVLQELFTAGLLWQEPCALLVYLVDGGVPQLPLAKRPPPHGYATPHWAPTVVRPIEHIAPATRAQCPKAGALEASP